MVFGGFAHFYGVSAKATNPKNAFFANIPKKLYITTLKKALFPKNFNFKKIFPQNFKKNR